jgi:hypothetical protein
MRDCWPEGVSEYWPLGVSEAQARWFEEEGKARGLAFFKHYIKENPPDHDPKKIALFYIHRAEKLRAGLILTKCGKPVFLTAANRALLDHHLPLVWKIVTKPGPLLDNETLAIILFVEIVGGLAPRLSSLLDKATGQARLVKANKPLSPEEQQLRRRISELDERDLAPWPSANGMLGTLQDEGFEGPRGTPIKVDAIARRIEKIRSAILIEAK